MPKSKEFIDDSDTEETKKNDELGSEDEGPKTSASKKSKGKSNTNVK